MGFETSISDCGTYAHINLKHSIMTAERSVKLAIVAAELIKSHGIKNFLIDARRAPHVSSILDQYNFAYYGAQEMGIDHKSKIAVIKNQGDHSRDFIKIVANNAGYSYKLFTDGQEAIDWLKTETPSMLMSDFKLAG